MSEQSDNLRDLVAVMRELHVAEAHGVKLNPVPQAPIEPKRATMEEQEQASEERKRAKFRILFGGDPTEEAWERLKGVL